MSNLEVSFNIEIPDSLGFIESRGLEPFGEVQRKLDSEIVRLCEPYVPFRYGTLEGSADRATDFGSGVITYDTPYAKKQYYENKGRGKDGTENGGMRGSKWFERMKADNIDYLRNFVSEVSGGEVR